MNNLVLNSFKTVTVNCLLYQLNHMAELFYRNSPIVFSYGYLNGSIRCLPAEKYHSLTNDDWFLASNGFIKKVSGVNPRCPDANFHINRLMYSNSGIITSDVVYSEIPDIDFDHKVFNGVYGPLVYFTRRT